MVVASRPQEQRQHRVAVVSWLLPICCVLLLVTFQLFQNGKVLKYQKASVQSWRRHAYHQNYASSSSWTISSSQDALSIASLGHYDNDENELFNSSRSSTARATPKHQESSTPFFSTQQNDTLSNPTCCCGDTASHLWRDEPYMQWYLEGIQNQVHKNHALHPPWTPVAFFHIGKTGGSTLCRQLRNGCHSWIAKPCRNVTMPESPLSILSTYYHTPDFGTRLASVTATHQYKVYVVTIREPLERLISAFTYQHFQNVRARGEADTNPQYNAYRKLFQCFPTLERFAQHVATEPTKFEYVSRPNNNINMSTSCTNMARAMINRQIFKSDHFYWTIQSVNDRLQTVIRNATSTPVIYLIRTEHLWEDWAAVNQCLIGSNNNITTSSNRMLSNATTEQRIRDHSDLNLPVKKTLSERGRRILCHAIAQEYNAYLQLVRMASNLAAHEKQQSVELAKQSCPWLDLKL